jgi:hypothetical protein
MRAACVSIRARSCDVAGAGDTSVDARAATRQRPSSPRPTPLLTRADGDRTDRTLAEAQRILWRYVGSENSAPTNPTPRCGSRHDRARRVRESVARRPSRLPPLVIPCSTGDRVRSEAKALAKRATGLGVDVRRPPASIRSRRRSSHGGGRRNIRQSDRPVDRAEPRRRRSPGRRRRCPESLARRSAASVLTRLNARRQPGELEPHLPAVLQRHLVRLLLSSSLGTEPMG